MDTQLKGSALLLFAKEPAPGEVKTRLGRAIGMESSAELARALLLDTLHLARAAATAVACRLVVVHAPDAIGEAFAADIEAVGAEVLPQGEGDLGHRLARAMDQVEGPRVAIGMDAPDLPVALIVAAFERLEPARSAVLGPCGDGGYYLLGLGGGVDPGFLAEKIRWSTKYTLSDTQAAMAEGGLEPSLLATHFDVDELEDLRRLAARLESSPDAAPATQRWLERHPDTLTR